MFVVAVPVFGVDLYPRMLPAAIVTLIVGGIAISAIGLAVASFLRRAESAPIAANLTLFPLLFVSGVFYPIESEPQWLQSVAHLFPLSHLVQAFDACFSPYPTGSGFSARDLGVLVVWGARAPRRRPAVRRRVGRRRARSAPLPPGVPAAGPRALTSTAIGARSAGVRGSRRPSPEPPELAAFRPSSP